MAFIVLSKSNHEAVHVFMRWCGFRPIIELWELNVNSHIDWKKKVKYQKVGETDIANNEKNVLKRDITR